MIKFFRHIRQNLIMENKTGKYFKYAIGEILLVVIGILIALQINNWNENRKAENVELDALKEVRNGLETDLEDVNYNLTSHHNKLKSQQIIIKWLESNNTFNDTLSKHIGKIHFGTYFQSNESPYQTLKQLGMRTIKNDSLRNQITSLYDLHYQQYNKYNAKYEDLTDQLILEAANYFNGIDWLGTNTKPTNEVGLKQNNKYPFYLKTLTKFNEILINQTMPNVINNINKTLAMIDKELETRQDNN